MKNSMENYSHLLELDEQSRTLTIYRIYESGSKELFTSVELPLNKLSEDDKGFRAFAQTLGENLLIDSPVARRLLGI